jgi:hypothetical protein
MRKDTLLDKIGLLTIRHSNWCLAIYSAVYWFVAVRVGASALLTSDEALTWKIARLPSVAAISQALLNGTDQELPLVHLLVRLSHFFFGASHLSSRLPSAFGFWICLCSIYFILKRHIPAPYALAGMLLPVITLPWYYAFEARAYGILLGSAAFAIACWDTAASKSPWRKPALAGITLGLAIALSTHMMALMLALPLALGESIRSMERRRIDYPVWMSFGLATPAVLMYPRVFQAAAGFDLRSLVPALETIPDFYGELLASGVFAVLVAALAAWLVRGDDDDTRTGGLPRHLLAALVALSALPAIFIVIAHFTKHFYFLDRYGLKAGIGLSALFAAAACSVFRGSVRCGVAILAVLTVWTAGTRLRPALRHMDTPEIRFAHEFPLLIEALGGSLPVVVTEPNDLGVADFYLPQPTAARLRYLSDHENAWRTPFEDVGQQLTARIKTYVSLQGSIQPYATFVRENRRFVIDVDEGHAPGWLYYLLDRDHCVVTLLKRAGRETIYTVEVP